MNIFKKRKYVDWRSEIKRAIDELSPTEKEAFRIYTLCTIGENVMEEKVADMLSDEALLTTNNQERDEVLYYILDVLNGA